jgi:aminoglycoside phosphotransferase (APT) family kinase protein
VLRRKPPGVLLKSAHAVDREFRVMRALFERGFPVPRAAGAVRGPGRPGHRLLRDAPRGRPGVPDQRHAGPDPAERAAVYDSANETLARLHTVDHVAAGLEDFGRPGNYFERQIGRLEPAV